ncbi:hypothetical protein INR49_009399 [Caranx melampygus]|nr:hypothetical protein INR49_009399 [Caranx melampygus]
MNTGRTGFQTGPLATDWRPVTSGVTAVSLCVPGTSSFTCTQLHFIHIPAAGHHVGSSEEARGPALRRRPAAGRSVALLRPSCGAPGRSV